MSARPTPPAWPARAASPHGLWVLAAGLLLMTVLYVSLPVARGMALQGLCLVLLGGLFTLQPRQVLTACALGIGLLALGLLALWRLGGPGFDPLHEGMSGLMTCLMLPAVAFVVYQFSLRRERLQAQQQALNDTLARMQQLTHHDPLTGLVNQRRMTEWIAQEAKRAQRAGTPLSVALMNLDHFRHFNERHGHDAGDRVMQRWAQTAQAVFRQTDVTGRWSDEDLIVLFVESTPEQALPGLERLRADLASQPPMDGLHAPTFSAGLVLWQSGDSVDQVIERARRALHDAKTLGRDRTVCAAPSQA